MGGSIGGAEPPKGSRRSERQKKPSSRFNEDAGFVPEPPRSSKKKVLHDEPTEGTSNKPFLLSNWSNIQLASYCNACAIVFTDSQIHCLNNLRLLESKRATPMLRQAETSDEVCVN